MNMAYLYGISDFWTEFFSSTDIVDGVLEQETKLLSEAYSYFLQRTSGISLEDVQDYHSAEISLLLLGSHNYISDTEFSVGDVQAATITNRSVLPTQTLYLDREFEIVDGVLRLQKPISDYKFPIRHNTDGSWQYAVWLNDVVFDGGWAYKSYGRLVGFDKDKSLDNYKAFLEGVYFLYTNGPTMAHVEKGINMAMGMPYARDTEEVLDIFEDVDTGDYVIITSSNSYRIPYGYNPNVTVGDVLIEGQVIDTWVEIIDYIKEDGWWYNIYLPNELLPASNSSALGRCIPGSLGDSVMQKAKYHIFEVLITRPAGDIDAFNIANRLVTYSRPSWTFPVFVWKVPIPDDKVSMEESLDFTLKNYSNETCISAPDIRLMRRNLQVFSRGKHWYNRNSISYELNNMVGQGDRSYAGYEPIFEDPNSWDLDKLAVIYGSRGTLASPRNRGKVTRGIRGNTTDVPYYITRVFPASMTYDGVERVVRGDQMVGLYLADKYELEARLGIELTGMVIIRSDAVSREGKTGIHTNELPLDHKLSIYAYNAYAPDVAEADLLISPCIDDTWSVSMIVYEPTVASTALMAEDSEHIEVVEVLNAPVTRGTVSRNGAPFLVDRGRPGGLYDNGRGDVYNMTRGTNFNGWKIPRRV
jgi:hypothetical protein